MRPRSRAAFGGRMFMLGVVRGGGGRVRGGVSRREITRVSLGEGGIREGESTGGRS